MPPKKGCETWMISPTATIIYPWLKIYCISISRQKSMGGITSNFVTFWGVMYRICAGNTKTTAVYLPSSIISFDIDGLVQERRNPSALAMVLRLCCTNRRYSYSEYQFITRLLPFLLYSPVKRLEHYKSIFLSCWRKRKTLWREVFFSCEDWVTPLL